MRVRANVEVTYCLECALIKVNTAVAFDDESLRVSELWRVSREEPE